MKISLVMEVLLGNLHLAIYSRPILQYSYAERPTKLEELICK